ncbi:MAG: hypothetical protein J1F64_06800, partial [Oscillospiraceae bacterium]|nr:hypothetical protein [Oscillospiraceae bacterium]
KSVFVQNPLNGLYRDIIYRTGDVAYENDDGNIIFVGRRDSQIKLRGNRIELGEIESSASAMDGVNGVCALFDSEKQEIALFLETPEKINARRFRMSLQRHIPKYMIPDRIVAVESFPYLPNGKINRMELRDKYINRKEEEK